MAKAKQAGAKRGKAGAKRKVSGAARKGATARRSAPATKKKATKKAVKRKAAEQAVKRKAAPQRASATAAPRRPAPRERSQPESLRLRTMSASLTVNDLERSLRFYRDGLGFVVADRWEEGGELVGYMLRAGSCEIGIGKDDWAKGRERVKGVGLRLWCETAQDVDAFAARVRARGYALTEEPADHSWGVRSFAVDDPDGFHLSIYRRIET